MSRRNEHSPPSNPSPVWGKQGPGKHSHANPSAAKGDGHESAGEVRLYGLNAVQAVFSRRPQAIRKV